ncbi:hypothetical protein KFL_000160200 [Klebsormidium nitens]|uniref:B box-type domain-containing protein n=1 Tax=Klebsormidium nitens TaxID=105231 RepID=A0A1Y1HPW7_KLENI|nr:hypothetical protein KFL_000160200 [Klebsormidium nitens]|eukprot:GAQ78617.1 hypothetical protein KFL_000160200 [Klebsormidium nitens]
MTRPQSASTRSQHPTACIECEDELATSWCEECRTSFCEECDLHQHHPKSLRREHVRTPISPPEPPAAAASRAGLLSKAFATEETAWSAEGDEDSAEDGPADSGLTSANQGAFSSGGKLESGSSHHALKSKRKHKKKRGKSRGHSKDRVEGGGVEAEGHEDGRAEPSPTKGLDCQVRKEKDGDSGGSSSVEHLRERPVWKKRKSSLKGSHEAAGEGPRQSLHVHWSPDVKDHRAEDHSPSYGSPRRFVPFISNRRKKYAEKHHKKHHKGAAEHADKRGKGKGRKSHEAPRSPGAKKAHLESAPATGLSDASESADSDAFSPVWPRDSSDKSEGTSDDSSFEDKMEPRHRVPDVQLKLPEARSGRGSEVENEEIPGGSGKEQGARTGSEAGLKMSEEVSVLKREGAALKAVPFGEIVSSSGAEDTAEESATEDDSMAGGMDLDSSETEMLAGGAKEQPPGRSWKWFERFMGKKKSDAPESKGPAQEREKAARSTKGPAKKGLVDERGGVGSVPAVEKSPLGLIRNSNSRAEFGAAPQYSRTAPAKAPAGDAPNELRVGNDSGELENARGRMESAARLAQGGDTVKAVCEYEAAIRLFRSQYSAAGRQALQGEAQAWEKIAALQKREDNGAAAGRGYLAAARVYQRLGMEPEMGACLQQARELQKGGSSDEEAAEEGPKAQAEATVARKGEKDSNEKQGMLTKSADDDSTRGTREFGNGNTSVEQDKVFPAQGSTVAVNSSPQPVQSSNKQDLAQGLVYNNEGAKGASGKRGPKKKGKGAASKGTSEVGVAKTAPGEGSDDKVQAETVQSGPVVISGTPVRRGDSGGSFAGSGAVAASQVDTTASIARSRKSGAAAVASGDADKGKALLVGALVAARKGGVKAEEARCLRLLADSQATEEQRVRTLEQAVQGMRDSGLRLEEAEALYRLADTKLTQYLGNKAAIQAAVSGVPGKEDVALVESARKSLLAAAQILQVADLWKGPETVSERPAREILSPTRTNRPEVVTLPARGKFAARNGRGGENAENGVTFGTKGASEGVPVRVGGPGLNGRNADEVRVLRELYGLVCQGVGKASILLGQMGAAKENFQEALSNVEWTSKYGDEAKRVRDIMGRLPR